MGGIRYGACDVEDDDRALRMVRQVAATIRIFGLTRARPVPRWYRDLARRVKKTLIWRKRDGDRRIADVESCNATAPVKSVGARLSKIDDENRRATFRRGEEIPVVAGDVRIDESNRRAVADVAEHRIAVARPQAVGVQKRQVASVGDDEQLVIVGEHGAGRVPLDRDRMRDGQRSTRPAHDRYASALAALTREQRHEDPASIAGDDGLERATGRLEIDDGLFRGCVAGALLRDQWRRDREEHRSDESAADVHADPCRPRRRGCGSHLLIIALDLR